MYTAKILKYKPVLLSNVATKTSGLGLECQNQIVCQCQSEDLCMFVEGFCQCSFLGISLCLLLFLCGFFSLLHQVFLCVIQQ